MRALTSNPNRGRNPMLPEPVHVVQPHNVTAPVETIREFIDFIITREPDPLICLWVALLHCYSFALNIPNSPKLDLFRDKLFGGVDDIFVVYMLIGCDYTIPGDSNRHERMYYGNKLGMWSGVDVHRKYVLTGIVNSYIGTTQYNRSTEFIERFATKAFMYMRPLCGRDVAGMIARMVAKMYLDDYKWMQSVSPGADGAEKVRMRISHKVLTRGQTL